MPFSKGKHLNNDVSKVGSIVANTGEAVEMCSPVNQEHLNTTMIPEIEEFKQEIKEKKRLLPPLIFNDWNVVMTIIVFEIYSSLDLKLSVTGGVFGPVFTQVGEEGQIRPFFDLLLINPVDENIGPE